MRTSFSYQNIRQVFIDGYYKLLGVVIRFCLSESRLIVFVVAVVTFGLALFYFVPRSSAPFYHDSLQYWGLANSFGVDNFSFVNYSNGLRGYFFPFLLFLIKKQAVLFDFDAKLLFQVYTALFFTVLSVYMVPWSLHTFFRWKTRLWGRLLIVLFLFFFWRGYFLYPLSDFPAFALLLTGVTLLLSSLRVLSVPLWVIFIGILLGAAVNTRPVYQISLIFLLPFVFLQFYRKGVAKAVTWLGLILLGFGLVLWPQLQINSAHFHVKSPWVLARVVDDENLFVKQLFWGLETQRYESSIGDNYPSIVVIYSDPFVSNLEKTNLLRQKTVARYITIMRRFPLELAISYFRHLFNGLDVFFPTPYIPNIFANHTFLSSVNYLIWFLVIFKLLKLDLSQLEYANVSALLSLLAPVVLAIPTAIEVRFFLPAHILAYGVVAFGLDYVQLAKSYLNNVWNILRFVLVCIFWIMICFTLSSTTVEYLVR